MQHLLNMDLEGKKDLLYNKDGNLTRNMFLVFFDPNGDGRWWNGYLKEGYRHVAHLTTDGVFWHYTTHTVGYTYSVWLPLVETYDEAIAFIKKHERGHNFSFVNVENIIPLGDDTVRTKFIMTPYTCTELVKAQLGIRDYFVLTPHQLYKYCKEKELILDERE